MTERVENDALEKGLKQPLLISSVDKQEDEDGDQEYDESEEASEDSHKPATSVGSAYRLLTPSVKVFDYSYTANTLIIWATGLGVAYRHHHQWDNQFIGV